MRKIVDESREVSDIEENEENYGQSRRCLPLDQNQMYSRTVHQFALLKSSIHTKGEEECR